MYFDEPAEAFRPDGRRIGTVLGLSGVAVLLFFVYRPCSSTPPALPRSRCSRMPGKPGLAGEAPVAFLDSVDSTNAEALRRARAGARGPLWIAAAQQTAGRGRRGRSWSSPPGNLHARPASDRPGARRRGAATRLRHRPRRPDACVALAPALAEPLAQMAETT